MTKKILVIGPESTGKSTLTTNLSTYFIALGKNSADIQEYARYWIDTVLGGDMDKLQFEHITHFGLHQMQLVMDAERYGDFDYIFSDTDAIVSTVFQEIYYGRVDLDLYDASYCEVWDLVLFTQPDVSWVADGQRNLGDRRVEVNEMFKKALRDRDIEYVEVMGDWDERFRIAREAVESIF